MPVCAICGGETCTGAPAFLHPVTFPFLPGGYPVTRARMPGDVMVTERIFFGGFLVATEGDQISAADAERWGVGADGKPNPPASPEPPEEPTPQKATKSKARTRPKPLETR